MLNKLDVEHYRVQALVMCPTRELAEQVAQEIRQLGRKLDNMKVLTLCGGSPMGPQISSLSHGAHVIVGTPGRIMDHLMKRRLDLHHVKTLVLDEADRMLDMGFEQEMETVIRNLPVERQTLLFSATYPDSIKQISLKIQRNPVEVSVEATHDTSKIEQIFYEVEEATELKQRQPFSVTFNLNLPSCFAIPKWRARTWQRNFGNWAFRPLRCTAIWNKKNGHKSFIDLPIAVPVFWSQQTWLRADWMLKILTR